MHYNIVVVSDSKYIQHTAVMLKSLFSTNQDKVFNIYLLTDNNSAMIINSKSDICKDTYAKILQDLCECNNSYFRMIECDLSEIEDLPVGQWSTFIYLKLFMPIVLPKEVKRCLFLDVDMIINDDISSLYNINLEGAVLAACEDIPDCIAHKERLKLESNDSYINSGVIVVDLEKWRNHEKKLSIFDYTRSVADVILNEQDVLSCYFRGKIKLLPIRWNMVTFYFMRKPKIFSKYLPELRDARLSPAIIHFAAPIKPWFKDCRHPYKYLYVKYLKITPWSSLCNKMQVYEKLSIMKRLSKDIKHLLNKVNIMKDPLYLSKRLF